MWLGAVEALYGAGTKFERDEAYADKMDALFAAYPDDTEARVFDALATMGRSHGTRDSKAYLRAAAMLEPVFKANPDHPGAVHYLIHAYDEPAYAERGLPMARVYNKVAPDSAHAQHMTSHIFSPWHVAGDGTGEPCRAGRHEWQPPRFRIGGWPAAMERSGLSTPSCSRERMLASEVDACKRGGSKAS